MPEFQQRGAEIVGCSIDSQYSHKAWYETPRNKGGIAGVSLPLIADVTKQISRDYGVLDEGKGIALRGTFIINEQGTVVSETVNFFSVAKTKARASASSRARFVSGALYHVLWLSGSPPRRQGLADVLRPLSLRLTLSLAGSDS